jgi:hypothetical protein
MRLVMKRDLLSLLLLLCVFPSGGVRTLKSIKDLAAPPEALILQPIVGITRSKLSKAKPAS